MKSSQMTVETAIKLVRFASLVLLCQNILWFISQFVIYRSDIIAPIAFFIVFTVDLLGFFILSVGYILFSQFSAKKKAFLGGSLCFLGWVIVRIISQYILSIIIFGNVQVFKDMLLALAFGFGDLKTAIETNEPDLTTLSYDQIVMLNFILGGFLLAVGTFLIWWAQKERNDPTQSAKVELIFLFYGLFNLVSIMVFIPLEYFSGVDVSKTGIFRMIGTALKGIIVPLIGIITFLSMYKKLSLDLDFL